MSDRTLPSIRVALEHKERIPTLDSAVDLWQRHLACWRIAKRLMDQSDIVSLWLGELVRCEISLIESWRRRARWLRGLLLLILLRKSILVS